MKPNQKLEGEVAAIGDLSREELTARWRKVYGYPPPKGINRGLLERSAAWHLQAGRVGGLSAAARAVLRAGRVARRKDRQPVEHDLDQHTNAGLDAERFVPTSPARSRTAAPLAVGTRLMREWIGRMHVVDVTEQGIL